MANCRVTCDPDMLWCAACHQRVVRKIRISLSPLFAALSSDPALRGVKSPQVIGGWYGKRVEDKPR